MGSLAFLRDCDPSSSLLRSVVVSGLFVGPWSAYRLLGLEVGSVERCDMRLMVSQRTPRIGSIGHHSDGVQRVHDCTRGPLLRSRLPRRRVFAHADLS